MFGLIVGNKMKASYVHAAENPCPVAKGATIALKETKQSKQNQKTKYTPTKYAHLRQKLASALNLRLRYAKQSVR
eukprot:2174258-Amphidinium_carterae.1